MTKQGNYPVSSSGCLASRKTGCRASILRVRVKEIHTQIGNVLACSNEQLNKRGSSKQQCFPAGRNSFTNSMFNMFYIAFYTTWQIPFISFSCHDSYSLRGPKQHWISGSFRTALGRAAPHISSWILHQSKGLVGLFCDMLSAGINGHMLWFNNTY